MAERNTRRQGSTLDRVLNLVVISIAVFVIFRPGGPVLQWVGDRIEERRIRSQIVELWPELISGGERLDRGEGEVRLVEFLDYRCPYCAETHPEMTAFLRNHADVGVVLRHLPVTGGPTPDEAARATICASRQDRFHEMHDHLFATERWAEEGNWELEAADVGLPNVTEFLACLNSRETDRRLERDRELSEALGVASTPSFVTRTRIARGGTDQRGLEALAEIP